MLYKYFCAKIGLQTNLFVRKAGWKEKFCMTEVQDIPVSVTYTGKTMQRNEVVDYLQQLCTYRMAFDELSEQYERRTKEFEAVKEKYDSTKWKVPRDRKSVV